MRDSCETGGKVRHLYERTNVAHRLPRGKRVSAMDFNSFKSNNEYENNNKKNLPISER